MQPLNVKTRVNQREQHFPNSILRYLVGRKGFCGQTSLGNTVCSLSLCRVQSVHRRLGNAAVTSPGILTQICFSFVKMSTNQCSSEHSLAKAGLEPFYAQKKACELSQGEPGGDYGTISNLCQAQKCTYDWPQLFLENFYNSYAVMKYSSFNGTMHAARQQMVREMELSAEGTEGRTGAQVSERSVPSYHQKVSSGGLSPSKQCVSPLTASYFIKF